MLVGSGPGSRALTPSSEYRSTFRLCSSCGPNSIGVCSRCAVRDVTENSQSNKENHNFVFTTEFRVLLTLPLPLSLFRYCSSVWVTVPLPPRALFRDSGDCSVITDDFSCDVHTCLGILHIFRCMNITVSGSLLRYQRALFRPSGDCSVITGDCSVVTAH